MEFKTQSLKNSLNLLKPFIKTLNVKDITLETASGLLWIRAGNSHQRFQMPMPAEVTNPGSVTVSWPDFEVIAALSEMGSLEVKAEGENLIVNTLNFKILEPMPVYTFAGDTGFVNTVIEPGLNKILKAIKVAAFPDQSRMALNGVHFNFSEGRLDIVATCGRRLLKKDMGDMYSPGAVTIPSFVIDSMIAGIDTTFTLNTFGRYGRVSFGSTEILWADVGKFPNYKQVLPDTTGHCYVTVNRKTAIKAVKVCNEFHKKAKDKSKMIKITFGQVAGLVLEALTEKGSIKAACDTLTQHQFYNNVIEIGISSKYLLEVLQVGSSETVRVNIKDQNHPLVLESDIYGLVMPMKL